MPTNLFSRKSIIISGNKKFLKNYQKIVTINNCVFYLVTLTKQIASVLLSCFHNPIFPPPPQTSANPSSGVNIPNPKRKSIQKQNQIEPASIDKMALPLPDKPSIIVFPFKNLSDDANQDYFCDGLTMDIIASLSKVPDIFVIARDSTFSFKGNPLNIKQVAEKLGVRYVLHGSVFKSENRIRITAFLTDAIKGNNLWAERYDRNLKDTFALQDDITINVLTALQVELAEGEKIRVLTKSTDNLDAYQKWMKGRDHFLRFNIEDNLIGRRLLEEAISLDPKFTSAYVDLAWTHIMEISINRFLFQTRNLDNPSSAVRNLNGNRMMG